MHTPQNALRIYYPHFHCEASKINRRNIDTLNRRKRYIVFERGLALCVCGTSTCKPSTKFSFWGEPIFQNQIGSLILLLAPYKSSIICYSSSGYLEFNARQALICLITKRINIFPKFSCSHLYKKFSTRTRLEQRLWFACFFVKAPTPNGHFLSVCLALGF